MSDKLDKKIMVLQRCNKQLGAFAREFILQLREKRVVYEVIHGTEKRVGTAKREPYLKQHGQEDFLPHSLIFFILGVQTEFSIKLHINKANDSAAMHLSPIIGQELFVKPERLVLESPKRHQWCICVPMHLEFAGGGVTE